MAKKITWRDLVDFSDSKEIKSAVTQLKLLNKEYARLSRNMKTQSKHINRALKDVQQTSVQLAQSTTKLTVEQEKQNQGLTKMAAAAEKAATSAKKLKQAKEGAEKVERTFGASVNDLTEKVKRQTAEFKKIDSSTQKGRASMKKLGIEIQNTKAKIKDLTAITMRQNNAFQRAEGSYNSLVKQNQRLRQELKNLPGAFSKNSKEVEKFRMKSKALETQIVKNNNRLKEFDKRIGDNFRNVGNYSGAIGKAGANLKAFAGQLLATTLGLMAMFQAVKQGFKSFTDFEFTITSVKALSGATEEQFAALEDQARSLGSTTSNTAGQVAQLQLELTKLGFKPEQIMQMTKSINQLSIAFDSDLGETAKIVGGTMKAFNLEMEQSVEVADLFAKASATSALDIEKIGIAMGNVAPAAAAANIDLSTTLAIVGKLVDQNIDASSASTGFRNVLLELSSAGSKLGKALGGTVNNEEDLFRALDELAEQGIDVTDSMIEAGEATGALGMVAELTGKRTAIALLSIVRNRKAIQDQNEVLKEGVGFLDEYSEIMGGTVKIAMAEATSAAEGFAITLFTELKPAINGILTLIVALFTALSAGVKIIKENKELFIALAAALLAGKIQAAAMALATLRLNAAQVSGSMITRNLTKVWKVLNATMKANPVGWIVAGLFALVGALKFAERWTTRFKETQETSNKISETTTEQGKLLTEVNENLADAVEDVAGMTDQQYEATLNANKAIRANSLETLGNLKIQNQLLMTQASQLTMWQKVKVAAMGGASVAAAAGLAAEYSAGNIMDATAETSAKIAEFEKILLGLDVEIARFEDERDKEHVRAKKRLDERSKKELASLAKLRIFRLEQQNVALQELMKNEKLSAGEKIKLAEDMMFNQIEIEEIKRDELLKNEELTAAGRTLIYEKFAAKIAMLAQQLHETTNQLVIDDMEKALAVLDDPDEPTDVAFDFDKATLANAKETAEGLLLIEQQRRDGDLKGEKAYQNALFELFVKQETDRIELMKKGFKPIADIKNAEAALLKKINNKEKLDEKEKWAAIAEFAQAAFANIMEFAGQMAQNKADRARYEVERAEADAARDIELAGDNEEQKRLIQEKADIRIEKANEEYKKAQMQKAKIDKATALVGAIVNTARGVAAAAPIIPLMIAIGALGAIQVATIAATPIPSFYKGTEHSPEGYANVGERGTEIMVGPDGDVQVADKPSVMYLQKGTKVLTAQQTQNMAQAAMDGTINPGDNYSNNSELLRQSKSDITEHLIKMINDGNETVIDAVAKMERFSFEGTNRGLRAYAIKGANRNELLSNRYN